MVEELLEFENTVEDDDGRSHVAVVLGQEREDGRWVGRIRFTPVGGSSAIETDRETTQPSRPDLVYWARGLTYFYLEGALNRARRHSGKAAARSAAAAPTSASPGTASGAAPSPPGRSRTPD
jgi:hypothetical protein